jgi:hypothetical protein
MKGRAPSPLIDGRRPSDPSGLSFSLSLEFKDHIDYRFMGAAGRREPINLLSTSLSIFFYFHFHFMLNKVFHLYTIYYTIFQQYLSLSLYLLAFIISTLVNRSVFRDTPIEDPY